MMDDGGRRIGRRGLLVGAVACGSCLGTGWRARELHGHERPLLSVWTLACYGLRMRYHALFALLAFGCGGSTAGGDQSEADAAAVHDASSDAPSVVQMDGNAVVSNDIDAASCMILASNYDQSCTTDMDCAGISAGNYCAPNQCFCGGSTISSRALPQFNADVAKTPVGSGEIPSGLCGCPVEFPPCCQAGQCVSGNACATDVVDAAPNDASGYTPDYTVLCVGDAGPADGGPSNAAAVPGVSRWCNGPEQCLSFNGGWACCVTMSPGVSFCVSP